MTSNDCHIRLLPVEVQGQIFSSYELTTPASVVEGLVTNALDAAARTITIEVDFVRSCITCFDDGTGIKHEEFSEEGALARPHCRENSLRLHCYVESGLTEEQVPPNSTPDFLHTVDMVASSRISPPYACYQ